MKLESWYTISNTQVTDDRLVVRLIPDHYNSDIVDPVITITVTQPENMQSALASLALLVDDFLIDLSVLSQSLQIWGEFSEQPTVITANSVSYTRSPHSSEDWFSIISTTSKHLSDTQNENRVLRMQLIDIENFVSKLLYNAEAKRSLTTRSTVPTDSQIDVLARILNRINSSKPA